MLIKFLVLIHLQYMYMCASCLVFMCAFCILCFSHLHTCIFFIQTPLFCAAKSNEASIAKLLVDGNADSTIGEEHGMCM